jgi:hypothetical protein
MSQASKPVARVGGIAFELERFELADGDRCELRGRWFGVRGRRFMRPALTVLVDGQSTRLLADLAGKPWAAEDGVPWHATFPFALRGELGEAELTVAPDITVALPLAAGQISAGKAKLRVHRTQRSRPTDTRDQTAARMDELLAQLSEMARERDEGRTERDRLAADLETSERERRRLESEREVARRERDEARQGRQQADEARDRAVAERGAAIAGQSRAEAERDSAVAARDKALVERDGAFALRDHAMAERDAALAARDDAAYQRDALSRTSERLQSELTEVTSARGAALVMRRAAHDRAISRRNTLLPGVIALVVVLAIVLVLLIVLHVL